jgi:hypothetical protein
MEDQFRMTASPEFREESKGIQRRVRGGQRNATNNV